MEREESKERDGSGFGLRSGIWATRRCDSNFTGWGLRLYFYLHGQLETFDVLCGLWILDNSVSRFYGKYRSFQELINMRKLQFSYSKTIIIMPPSCSVPASLSVSPDLLIFHSLAPKPRPTRTLKAYTLRTVAA